MKIVAVKKVNTRDCSLTKARWEVTDTKNTIDEGETIVKGTQQSDPEDCGLT